MLNSTVGNVGSEINTARSYAGGGGTSNTDVFIWGGGQPVANNGTKTEAWNGSAWTEVNDLAVARDTYANGAGSATNGITAGGYNGSLSPTNVANTEEWNFPPVTQNKLKEGMIFLSGGTTLKGFGKAAGTPAGTWSSGGNYPISKEGVGATGTRDAALGFGGSPATAVSAEYDGTSWTAGNNMNTPTYYRWGAGTQAAGMAAGGGGPPFKTETELYNGTNWSEVNDMNIGRSYAIYNVGTQTAGYFFGGFIPTNPNATTSENWDGTNWTSGTAINSAREASAAWGIQTSAIMAGGTAPPGRVNTVESWNGTAWSEIAEINTARSYAGGGGQENGAGIIYGGDDGSLTAKTEFWNGSSWTELADLSTAKQAVGNTGSAVAAIAFGGGAPSVTNATEEWTVDATLSTVTVS